MSARLDAATGDPYYTTSLPGDVRDNQHMQAFMSPAAGEAAPWWQGVVQYGLTRAIDNRFSPPNVTGNVTPGSFGGANGQTYFNGINGGSTVGGIPTWVLLAAGLGLVAFIALK